MNWILPPRDHPKQVARVIGIGQHIEICVTPRALQLIANVAQGREILGRKSDAIKQCNLLRIAPPLSVPGDDFP